MDFSALALSPPLLQVLAELKFQTATPIQAQSIPVLLKGRDLVGQAKTGSGKTAAFALPLLQKIQLSPRRLQALVLCPTRELCAQVAGDIRRLGRRLPGLQVLVLAGGQPIRPQLEALEKGVHLAVGTPGRVLDLLQREALDTRQVTTVVLDEADRMLDMGFREDMERILGATPKTRQTVLFSATFPTSIEAMSRAFQKEPVRVTVEADTDATPPIQQLAYPCALEEKTALLLRLLRHYQPASAIVFCNLKATVTEVARALSDAGVSADGLQGDLEQNDRDRVMAKFRNHSTRVLVATDVAGRGIDVEALDAVFNFDLPSQPEPYVHRIGRTGRAGRAGLAVALVTPRDDSKVEEIEFATKVKLEQVRVESLPADPGAKAVLGSAWETLCISAGRKDKMRPGDILGALTGEAGGLKATDIGKIEIQDRLSYVAVAKAVARVAHQSLSQGRIKGRKHLVERLR